MTIRIEHEWADPGEARGDDLRATWARLKIVIDGRVVTQVLDHRTQAERDAIYMPLVPLAEWLTANWFFLQSEVGSRHTRDTGYFRRHSLAHVGDGYILPDLQFIPDGDNIGLHWRTRRPPFARLTFLDSGNAYYPRAMVLDALAGLIDAIVDRLVSQGNESHPLIDDWAGLQRIADDELPFAQAASSLGFDPFDMPAPAESMILMAHARLPASIFDDFLAVTRFDELPDQIVWVTRAIASLEAQDGGFRGLRDFRDRFAPIRSNLEPHENGRRFARQVRAELTIETAPVIGLHGLIRLFGGRGTPADCGITIRDEPNQAIVAIADNDDLPRFLLTRPREDSQRFALSRAIFDYLWTDNRFDLVSDSFMAKDKASRAFAAELLAPAEGIQRYLTEHNATVVDEELIFDIAQLFDVSTRIVENQIANHQLAEIVPAT